jgi:DNA-binding transcriptional ArsR family regulator
MPSLRAGGCEPKRVRALGRKIDMPHNSIATLELASLLEALAHRHRIRIVEELRHGERDAGTLQQMLNISASNLSQHLKILKIHHLLTERREGRHIHYRLTTPELAQWLASGLRFVEAEIFHNSQIHTAVEHARQEWLAGDPPSES